MLDEVPRGDARVELVGREEVIIDAVDLARPRGAGRGRHGQLEAGHPLEQSADQRALPDAGGAGDHEDLGAACHRREPARGDARTQRRRMSATSSRRWRSDKPPTVLLGEILHCPRILLTFTRPYLGTASRRSNTLAVSRYVGGASRSSSMGWRPALRSRLSWAR